MFWHRVAAYREEMDLPSRLSTGYIPGALLALGTWAQTVTKQMRWPAYFGTETEAWETEDQFIWVVVPDDSPHFHKPGARTSSGCLDTQLRRR